ncbi:hypothetical protein T11_9559 [Trichinella zimbabwensis]|uniref:Uncharacterized protein n=1 Tax=Trichinella zimbabwensis TaxID=268475 RepID=A0A0V1I7J5_9BILA|nr:hypothetical protein T11_9559 [Trichinella zimbabwensis]
MFIPWLYKASSSRQYLFTRYISTTTDKPVHSYTYIALTITIPASAIKSDQLSISNALAMLDGWNKLTSSNYWW